MCKLLAQLFHDLHSVFDCGSFSFSEISGQGLYFSAILLARRGIAFCILFPVVTLAEALRRMGQFWNYRAILIGLKLLLGPMINLEIFVSAYHFRQIDGEPIAGPIHSKCARTAMTAPNSERYSTWRTSKVDETDMGPLS
jgi:hypothetical protein